MVNLIESDSEEEESQEEEEEEWIFNINPTNSEDDLSLNVTKSPSVNMTMTSSKKSAPPVTAGSNRMKRMETSSSTITPDNMLNTTQLSTTNGFLQTMNNNPIAEIEEMVAQNRSVFIIIL